MQVLLLRKDSIKCNFKIRKIQFELLFSAKNVHRKHKCDMVFTTLFKNKL